MLYAVPAAYREAELHCTMEEPLFTQPFGAGCISTVKALWHENLLFAHLPLD